jgi:hypothetical protein
MTPKLNSSDNFQYRSYDTLLIEVFWVILEKNRVDGVINNQDLSVWLPFTILST